MPEPSGPIGPAGPAGPAEVLARLRWGGEPSACPRCGVPGRCAPLDRDVRTRQVWRCAACRAQFSVLTGTVLERSRTPAAVWLALATDLAGGATSARESARRHGITAETARLLRARLAAAGVRPGDDPHTAMAGVLRLPPAEVTRVCREVVARRRPRHGPTREYS